MSGVDAALLARLAQGSAHARQVVQALQARPHSAAQVLALAHLSDAGKLWLLARPEVLGTQGLGEFVDLLLGDQACCNDCKGKDTHARRRTFKGAIQILHCHIDERVRAQGPGTPRQRAQWQAAETARVLGELGAFIERGVSRHGMQ